MALSTIGRNQLNTGIDDNSDATAITIDNSEKVAIGTTSTAAGQVTIQGSGNPRQLVITDDGAEKLQIFQVGNDATIEAGSGGSNSTNLIFKTSSSGTEAERMRIDGGGGNVGIGGHPVLSSSAYNGASLHLRQPGSTTTGGQLRFTTGASGHTASDGAFISYFTDNNLYYNNQESGDHRFFSGGSERMRIDSGGNVMFNQNSTSSPGLSNTTQGAVISDTGRLFSSVNGAWSLFNRNTDNGDVILFRRSGSGVGSISVTTSSTSYNTSSDYRLKENIADITGAIARVKQLAPKRFNFIADPDDTTVDGFLAHEAQTVVPEAVTGTHNGLETWTQREIDDGEAPDGTSAGDNKLDEDGNTIPEMQGIDQSKLVPLLTAALKESIAKIETLETEMTALKARVTALEGA